METDKGTFRYAEKSDASLVLEFMKRLAEYEKAPEFMTATKELLEEELFEKNGAEVLFVMADGKEVGFALFFQNFAGYLGRRGLFLDSFLVLEEYRGKGYGKALFMELERIAAERGYGRMEWICLDWNEPSREFYRARGGKCLDTCRTFRMEI